MTGPMITVTPGGPADGGDFGPGTPNTRTSGIQEAIDAAHREHRGVYIHGGRGGMHRGEFHDANVYLLDATLEIPWSQDFRLDGDNYVLQYRPTEGDAVTFDSQMNCRYKLGLIVASSSGATVRIRPRTPGPDDFAVVVGSIFDFSAIVAHGSGPGLVLDASDGPIVHSRVFAEEVNSLTVGVRVTGSGRVPEMSATGVTGNVIEVMYNQQHMAAGSTSNLILGDERSVVSHNLVRMGLQSPRGSYFDADVRRYLTPAQFVPRAGCVGARIDGQLNRLELACFGPRQPGEDVVFGPSADQNVVETFDLPNGATDLSPGARNVIRTNHSGGPAVVTPAVGRSGEPVQNRANQGAQIVFTEGGVVDRVGIVGAGAPPIEWSGPVQPGATVTLQPGESVVLRYSQAPAWRWRRVEA